MFRKMDALSGTVSTAYVSAGVASRSACRSTWQANPERGCTIFTRVSPSLQLSSESSVGAGILHSPCASCEASAAALCVLKHCDTQLLAETVLCKAGLLRCCATIAALPPRCMSHALPIGHIARSTARSARSAHVLQAKRTKAADTASPPEAGAQTPENGTVAVKAPRKSRAKPKEGAETAGSNGATAAPKKPRARRKPKESASPPVTSAQAAEEGTSAGQVHSLRASL